MAQTKNALIRYKTLDLCFQNRFKKWTLDMLIEEVSDKLCKAEGRDVNISRRTIQKDIQLMRSDRLGYNAPIIVYEKKFYTYSDPNYSITALDLNDNDLSIISESMKILQEFNGFSLFSELGDVLNRLEDVVYSEKNKQAPVILIDKNKQLRGLEYLDQLYRAIINKVALKVTYKSFKALEEGTFSFSPFLLREFNNRWFVVGTKKGKHLLHLALDRIEGLEIDLRADFISVPFDPETYYKDAVGVSVQENARIMDVKLWVDAQNAPYVLTKPLHQSQTLLERQEDGAIHLSLSVIHNFELERLLLGFGKSIEVISPRFLRKRIAENLEEASIRYK